MREYSTALQVNVPATGNLTDDVVRNGDEHPDTVLFSRRVEGTWARRHRRGVPRARCVPWPRG